MVGDTCGGTMCTHTQGHTSPLVLRDSRHAQTHTNTGSDTHSYGIHARGCTHNHSHTEGSQSQPEVCMLQLSPSHTQVNRSAQTLVYRLTGPDPAL